MKTKFFGIALIACLVFFQCNANNEFKGKKSVPQQHENLDIYLLIGQSNMAGRASIKLADKDTLENVFLFTGNDGNLWEKAANPLNKYSSIRKDIAMQKMGPGYAFAMEIQKATGKEIGLVVNAKGGTKIEEWAPGTEFYNEAVVRTKAALKYGTLKGIIWHQGESNTSKYKQYMSLIIELIESLRADFGNSDLPFVAGQLSADKAKRANFNLMILTLPDNCKNCGVATSEGTSTIDSTHFNPASQHLMGKRYAAEMLKFIDN